MAKAKHIKNMPTSELDSKDYAESFQGRQKEINRAFMRRWKTEWSFDHHPKSKFFTVKLKSLSKGHICLKRNKEENTSQVR